MNAERHRTTYFGSSSRGIALLLVITVLVTLVLVAVPFAISARQGRERTNSELAKGRALFEADLLLEAMKHALGDTHPMLEQERWFAGERGVESDPTVDSLDEITLGDAFRKRLEESWTQSLETDSTKNSDPRLLLHLENLRRRGLGPMNDDRGSIWTGVVEDANAKVNPNAASPYLLGALMGSALVAEETDPSAPDIAVEFVASSKMPSLPSFPADGGWIRIGGETIRYTTFDGSVFRGCERGALPDAPLLDGGTPETYQPGTPVVNHVAYKLATHLVAGWKGRPGYKPDANTPFRNLEDLRSIASWGGGPGLTAERLDLIRPYLTVWSRRETASGWLASQVVVNALPTGNDATTPDEIELKDQFNPSGTTAYANSGSLLRISDGVHTVYQMVNHVGDTSGGQLDRVVTLCGRIDAGYTDAGVSFEGGRAMAAVLAPYPININTAPKEVLYANMVNLRLRTMYAPEATVIPEVARSVTERILEERALPLGIDAETGERQSGPFRNTEDYGRFLSMLEEEGVLSTQQRAALYFNAVNPHDWGLTFGTAPWCYRTLDVYHLEARVAVNDGNGEQIATAIKREVAEIGSDGKTAWTLDSQDDFEQRMSMGSGAKWVATGPRGVTFRGFGGQMRDASNPFSHIQPALRAPKGVFYGVYPSPERSEQDERGEAYLEPARVEMRGAQRANHFDSSLFTEGWRTDFGGVYELPVRKWLRAEKSKFVQPFSVSFWWRPYSDANWTAIDCGMQRFQNRFAIFVADGEQGQDLVFRASAGTLEQRGAEIHVPMERINFQPGTWYHLHASCAGEDPSLMEFFVDGVSVGDRNGLSHLVGGVNEDATELLVERTAGTASVGALLVGSEVVEYDTRSGESFGNCVRGARGTTAKAWPEGTPVRELGYSLPLMQDVMRGGARLESPLGAWTAAAVWYEGDDPALSVTTYADPNSIPPLNIEFQGFASPEDQSDTESIEVKISPIWGCSEDETAKAFGTEGIAILGCQAIRSGVAAGIGKDANDRNLYGWEFVYYERDEGVTDSIRIVERHLPRQGRDSEYPAIYSGGGATNNESFFLTTVWRDMANPGTFFHVPAFLIPLSIAGSSSGNPGDDYLNPDVDANSSGDREILSRYGGFAHATPGGTRAAPDQIAGRVCIGLPDEDAGLACEVVRYDSITRDKGSQMLFVRDGNLRGLPRFFFPSTRDSFDDGGGEGEMIYTAVEEVIQGEAATTVREDVKPPGETRPPEEDPEVDSSGSGDNEYGEVEYEYPDELIEAVRDPSLAADWPPDPSADASAGYGEPAYPASFLQSFRGSEGTFTRTHDLTGDDRETLILPCFRVYEGPCVGDQDSFFFHGRPRTDLGAKPVGRNDRVTFSNGDEEDPIRYPGRIRWAQAVGPWAALDAFIDRRFLAAEEKGPSFRSDQRDRVRMLKFPCGELPDELPENITFGQSVVSNSEVVTAMLDEFHSFIDLAQPIVYLAPPETESETDTIHGVQSEDREIRLIVRRPFDTLDDTPGHDQDCGLLSLDGELIVWRGASIETDSTGRNLLVLERCERGVLGTVPRFHAEGAHGRLVSHWPVSYLDGRLNRDAASIPLVHARHWWPREGLVRILGGEEAELVHYSRRSENELILPEALDADEKIRGRGLLRGRFGTDIIDHDAEEIVFWQPFRYWDRYMPRRTEDQQSFSGVHTHPDGSYLEVGKRIRSGYWHRVTWQEGPYDDLSVDARERRTGSGGAGTTGFLDVIILGRFSPTVPWDSDEIIDMRNSAGFVTAGPGATDARPVDRLYVFDDPEAANRLGLESEVAEFRVFFVYRPGAFLPQDGPSAASALDEAVFENSWKLSPSLKSFTVEYTSRTSTLSRSRNE